MPINGLTHVKIWARQNNPLPIPLATPTISKYHPWKTQPKNRGDPCPNLSQHGNTTSPVVTNTQLGQDSVTPASQNKTMEIGDNPCPKLNRTWKVHPRLTASSSLSVATQQPTL